MAAAVANVRRYYDRPAEMSPASVQTIITHLLTGLLLSVATYSTASSFPLLPLVLGGGAAVLSSFRTYAALDSMRKAFLANHQT